MTHQKSFIAKVYKNKVNGQKLITIPKKFRSINKGDYVKVIKVKVIEF